MGNSVGCFGLGERLAAAAREGDVAEVRRLLAMSPGVARYVTFAALNSPLHFAAAKGHSEVVALLLENGADVNSRNIYGQTPLMQACRFGHWEVVQTLLVFGSNVSKVEALNSRTALYFAAAGGHVRCIRLLLADFAPSGSYGSISFKDGEKKTSKTSALSSFVNKPATGAVTALHVAALHGHADCVHLLLDVYADVSAKTLHYASSPMNSIGAGSTPLHYAACGGNLKCCQILISRGASRSTTNCNGWLPLDVSRMWGSNWLEQLLIPKSTMQVPVFPPSSYLSLPLASVLDIARDCGLQFSILPSDIDDEDDVCAVCLERSCDVASEGCGHELCVKCALDLCSAIKAYDTSGVVGSIPCPLCRSGIASFRKLPSSIAKDSDLNLALSHCKQCFLQSSDLSITVC